MATSRIVSIHRGRNAAAALQFQLRSHQSMLTSDQHIAANGQQAARSYSATSTTRARIGSFLTSSTKFSQNVTYLYSTRASPNHRQQLRYGSITPDALTPKDDRAPRSSDNTNGAVPKQLSKFSVDPSTYLVEEPSDQHTPNPSPPTPAQPATTPSQTSPTPPPTTPLTSRSSSTREVPILIFNNQSRYKLPKPRGDTHESPTRTFETLYNLYNRQRNPLYIRIPAKLLASGNTTVVKATLHTLTMINRDLPRQILKAEHPEIYRQAIEIREQQSQQQQQQPSETASAHPPRLNMLVDYVKSMAPEPETPQPSPPSASASSSPTPPSPSPAGSTISPSGQKLPKYGISFWITIGTAVGTAVLCLFFDVMGKSSSDPALSDDERKAARQREAIRAAMEAKTSGMVPDPSLASGKKEEKTW